jgi:hypothetical protein
VLASWQKQNQVQPDKLIVETEEHDPDDIDWDALCERQHPEEGYDDENCCDEEPFENDNV